MINKRNTQDLNTIYYCSDINIYNLSKLLFLLSWEHKLIFNENKSNILHFNDNDKLLIFTNSPILSCNVECIVVSSKVYNNKNIIGYIKEILPNIDIDSNVGNILDKLTDLNDVDSYIYTLFGIPAISFPYQKKITQNTTSNLNLPIMVYQLKKSSKYNELCQIFTYLFKETSMHSLALILYNIVNILKQKPTQQSLNNINLLPDMVLY